MKNPFSSKTIDGIGLLVLVLLNRILGIEVPESEIGLITEGAVALAGVVLAVYGRLKARDKVSLNPFYVDRSKPSKFPVNLGLVAVSAAITGMLMTLPGCQHYQELPPEHQEIVRNISKAATAIALNIALDQIDQRIGEARPYVPALRQTVQYALTFEAPQAADEIAAALAQIPEPARAEALAIIRTNLAAAGVEVTPGTVASPPEIYGNRLLHALPKK